MHRSRLHKCHNDPSNKRMYLIPYGVVINQVIFQGFLFFFSFLQHKTVEVKEVEGQ